MLVMQPCRPRFELVERTQPHGVGKHRVVASRHGQQPLGTPDDEHRVEVMADGRADRAVHHAVPEATMTAAGDVEFGPQRTLEHCVRRIRLDVGEGRQPGEGILDAFEGVLFVIGPAGVNPFGPQQ